MIFWNSCISIGELNMSDKLILLHEGKENVINIFIHGFNSVPDNEKLDELSAHILSAKPTGKIFLLAWNSGSWKDVPRFWAMETRSEVLGKKIPQFLRRLNNKYKNTFHKIFQLWHLCCLFSV